MHSDLGFGFGIFVLRQGLAGLKCTVYDKWALKSHTEVVILLPQPPNGWGEPAVLQYEHLTVPVIRMRKLRLRVRQFMRTPGLSAPQGGAELVQDVGSMTLGGKAGLGPACREIHPPLLFTITAICQQPALSSGSQEQLSLSLG